MWDARREALLHGSSRISPAATCHSCPFSARAEGRLSAPRLRPTASIPSVFPSFLLSQKQLVRPPGHSAALALAFRESLDNLKPQLMKINSFGLKLANKSQDI